jgi:hypothetical protein
MPRTRQEDLTRLGYPMSIRGKEAVKKAG